MDGLVSERSRGILFALLAVCACPALVHALAPAPEDPIYRQRVESDWASQEKRWGRTPQDAAALRAALTRLEALIAEEKNGARLSRPFIMQAEVLARNANEIESWRPSERLERYRQVRWLCRQMTLSYPAVSSQPLVFMTRNRFICQMLHEYLGYFYDYGDIAGGGVIFSCSRATPSKTRDLIKARLPKGNFTTLALSHDGRPSISRLRSARRRNRISTLPQRRSFHLFGMSPDGSACASSRVASRIISTLARCRMAGWLSCRPGAEDLAGATIPGSRSQLHACTHGSPTGRIIRTCRCTRPASGIPL